MAQSHVSSSLVVGGGDWGLDGMVPCAIVSTNDNSEDFAAKIFSRQTRPLDDDSFDPFDQARIGTNENALSWE